MNFHRSWPLHDRLAVMRDSERGNVLYYIFIAVALLGALSYAVAQGTRGSAKGLTEEKQRLLAAEIIDFGDVVKKAVATLRLRGISFSGLEFSYPGSAGYDNAACAADECNIFSTGGGGVLYKSASAQALGSPQPWVFAANNEIQDVGLTAGDATSTDLLVILPDVVQGVCVEINGKLGVINPSGEPPEDAGLISLCLMPGAARIPITIKPSAMKPACRMVSPGTRPAASRKRPPENIIITTCWCRADLKPSSPQVSREAANAGGDPAQKERRAKPAAHNPGSPFTLACGSLPGMTMCEYFLLHRHAFRQIARLVDIGALGHGRVIGQQLRRDRIENRRDIGVRIGQFHRP